MGIVFGLTAALAWGIGDFFVTTVARRLGALRALLASQFVGFSLVALFILPQGIVPQAPAAMWRLAFFLGALNFIAAQLMYRAFQIGKLSLVSPLASSYTVVTALLAFASGERPAASALFGAALLLVGVILATQKNSVAQDTPNEKANSNAGVLEAGIAALCFGIVFWGLDVVVPSLGIYWPLFLLRLVPLIAATTIWFGWIRPRQSPVPSAAMSPPTHSTERRYSIWWIIALSASCETAAWLSFNAGTQTEYTTIVTALSSLFSVFAIIFARIFFKEELSRMQWAGVAIILTGILMVSVKPQAVP